MTWKLNSGILEAPYPSLVLEMYVLTTVLTARAIFKNAVLGELSVIETILTEYATKPS